MSLPLCYGVISMALYNTDSLVFWRLTESDQICATKCFLNLLNISLTPALSNMRQRVPLCFIVCFTELSHSKSYGSCIGTVLQTILPVWAEPQGVFLVALCGFGLCKRPHQCFLYFACKKCAEAHNKMDYSDQHLSVIQNSRRWLS